MTFMLSTRRIWFFMQQNHRQLKKKWGTLLLLFLFPIVLIGMLLGLVAGLLMPEESSPIRVVLVDEDQTKESLLFSTLLEETAAGNPFIQIASLSESDAEQLMERNEISTYFSFPKGFTEDLYEGESVTIPIVGNPLRPTESFVVKELVESLARYIATAQANILTINDYAKKTSMPKDERQELLFQQFMDFTLYTLGKDKLLDEEVITECGDVITDALLPIVRLVHLLVYLASFRLYHSGERGTSLHDRTDAIIRRDTVATGSWPATCGICLQFTPCLVPVFLSRQVCRF